MFKDFRKFIARGNVIDLAVGIMIGTAFTAIVNSLVNDLLMPPLGLLIGEVDLSSIAITIREGGGGVEPVTIGVGAFINVCLRFLIIAFVVFVFVRAINRLRDRSDREKGVSQPATPEAPEPAPEPASPPRTDPRKPTTGQLLLNAINELTDTIKEMNK